jgi:branched-chain amino acid transport system ATP-binding protein
MSLEVQNLSAGYGPAQVLFDVNFKLNRGQSLGIAGRNGAGKSTLIKAILGVQVWRQGALLWNTAPLAQTPTHKLAELGIGFCPDDRGLFSMLSCQEHLRLAAPKFSKEAIEVGYSLFPRLKERAHVQATKLSGGEQQMLAIARLFVSDADLLLIDEPTEGIAPMIVADILKALKELKKRGKTLLVADQNFDFLSELSDDLLMLSEGQIKESITQSDFKKRKEDLTKWLHL